jgi:hypothetical protein
VGISTPELAIANLPQKTNIQIEQQLTHISAREPLGLYSYVHNTSIIYSMVSIPRRNILSTPVGGTQPLITFWLIQRNYRYTKRLNKPTSSPIMTYLRPTYLYTHSLPPCHVPIPSNQLPHQPPHPQPAPTSQLLQHQRPKHAL